MTHEITVFHQHGAAEQGERLRQREGLRAWPHAWDSVGVITPRRTARGAAVLGPRHRLVECLHRSHPTLGGGCPVARRRPEPSQPTDRARAHVVPVHHPPVAMALVLGGAGVRSDTHGPGERQDQERRRGAAERIGGEAPEHRCPLSSEARVRTIPCGFLLPNRTRGRKVVPTVWDNCPGGHLADHPTECATAKSAPGQRQPSISGGEDGCGLSATPGQKGEG